MAGFIVGLAALAACISGREPALEPLLLLLLLLLMMRCCCRFYAPQNVWHLAAALAARPLPGWQMWVVFISNASKSVRAG